MVLTFFCIEITPLVILFSISFVKLMLEFAIYNTCSSFMLFGGSNLPPGIISHLPKELPVATAGGDCRYFPSPDSVFGSSSFLQDIGWACGLATHFFAHSESVHFLLEESAAV